MGRFRPSFAPLKPSSLRGLSCPTSPTSPISPRSPLHLPHLPSPREELTNAFNLTNLVAIETPPIPMPWVWSCHRCQSRYLLGTTRRCLLDGHYFCGGTTVNKVTGKMKKHRACVSEFDYIGWEDFGRWKRATSGQIVRLEHCEDECDFPSSCHWKKQHAIQETESAFIGPYYLDTEPDVFLVDAKPGIPRGTKNHIRKNKRAGEKRTRQVVRANLAPIEEEDQKAPLFLDTTSKVNGLGLHPVVDFSSSKTGAKESRKIAERPQINLLMPEFPQMSARVDSVWEDDVDMAGCITQKARKSPPISPRGQPDAIEVPFDFGLGQDDSLPTVDDDSPISPTGSLWSWTAGGIGVALSPPDSLVECNLWEGQMADEMVASDMSRDGGGCTRAAGVDRRHSS